MKEKTYTKTDEINPNWTRYDQIVASTHLTNYGVIFCDLEYGMPIDDEVELLHIVEEEIPGYFEEGYDGYEDNRVKKEDSFERE